MKNNTPIAVASRSFSQHPVLRPELLERYSDVRFNDEGVALGGESLIEFARGRSKLIIALEKIDETILTALPELEVISKYGVGTDMLDKSALIRHGIRLGWTGGVNKRSVTELAIALMISCCARCRRRAEKCVRASGRTAREGNSPIAPSALSDADILARI